MTRQGSTGHARAGVLSTLPLRAAHLTSQQNGFPAVLLQDPQKSLELGQNIRLLQKHPHPKRIKGDRGEVLTRRLLSL